MKGKEKERFNACIQKKTLLLLISVYLGKGDNCPKVFNADQKDSDQDGKRSF